MAVRVAVIDDDPLILYLLSAVLEASEYQSLLLGKEGEVIEPLAAFAPHVIILDLLLWGEVDGWEVLAGIRAHPALKTTPVILCTAMPQAVDGRAEELQVQNTWFLAKPFELAALTSLIQTLLVQHEPPPCG